MTATNPLISVIIPVYNVEKYLPACLDSVLAQTYNNLEVLLIDDGSMDTSGAICDRYAAQESRIRVIHQKNGGVASARNAGVRAFCGEYVMFVDSDDLLIADAFCNLQIDADMVVFDYLFMKGNRIYDKKMLNSSYGTLSMEDIVRNIVSGQPGFSWGILYRRDYLWYNKFSFDKNFIQCEDAVFNFSIMVNMPNIVYVNRKAYQYNYNVMTALNRWKKSPEAMIYSGYTRHKMKTNFVKTMLPESYGCVLRSLSINRIHAIYGNAVDLCCVGQATKENRQKVEKMMMEIDLPRDANIQTRCLYKQMICKRWVVIWIYAQLRMAYLKIIERGRMKA